MIESKKKKVLRSLLNLVDELVGSWKNNNLIFYIKK